MSVTIFLQEKKIKLIQETKALVDFYAQALANQQFKLKSDEQGMQTTVALGEAQPRKGLWAKYITTTIESITQNPHGAQFLILPAQEIELEVPAELLLRSYVAFLNEILIEQGITAESTELREIESKYVLMRELLYRLIGVALSNKLDYQNDGENLLNALRSFINKVCESEILTENPMFGHKKASKFLSSLATVHPKWTAHVEQMVLIVKLVRSNVQAISKTLNKLKEAERIIQRQLIAFLDNQQHPDNFTSEWLDNTLSRCELQILEKPPLKEISSQALTIRQSFNLTEKQGALLIRLPKDELFEARVQKIGALYNLLNKTENLYEMMAHLDLLMTYSGWMPILAGVIDFNKLGNLMKHYSKTCEKVLEIPSALQNVLKTSAGRGLLKHQAATGEELSYTVLQNVKELVQLQDKVLKQRIERMIGAAVLSLVRLQSQLDSNYHFINVERIESGGWLSLEIQPSSLSPAIKDSEQKAISTILLENHQIKEENKRLLQENQRVTKQSDLIFMVTQLLHTNLINGCQSKEILDMLKEQGADLGSFCAHQNAYEGSTALHIAASTDNLFACQWLLNQGIEINIPDSRGETALDKASKRGHLKIIQYLKEQKGKSREIEQCTQTLHYIIDEEKITEEDSSVTTAHIEKLSQLVKRGADVNGVNTLNNAWNGDRPLHTLLVKRNCKLIHWFMGMGANPQLVDARHQETPYQRLCRVSNNPGPIEELISTYYSKEFLGIPQQTSPVVRFSNTAQANVSGNINNNDNSNNSSSSNQPMAPQPSSNLSKTNLSSQK